MDKTNFVGTPQGSKPMKISFCVKEVREYLDRVGFVVTVRSFGNYEKFCDSDVGRVSVEKLESYSEDKLEKYLKDSGFEKLEDWKFWINKFGVKFGYIYKVSKMETMQQKVSGEIPQGTRIGIVGSRRRTDRQSVVDFVNSLPVGSVVVSGGCHGVDSWAASAARQRGLVVREFRPDFAGFETLSYPEKCQRYYERNLRIVQNSDVIHAFVASDRTGGTENTIQHANKLGIPVILHEEQEQETKNPDFLSSGKVSQRAYEEAFKTLGIRVLNSWKFRGRLHVIVLQCQESLLQEIGEGFTAIKQLGNFRIYRSNEIDSDALMKQIRASSRDSETKELEKAQYLWLLKNASYGEDESNDKYYDELDDELVQKIEDELDSKQSKFSLSVPEGYAGHLYKEDLDLERAGKPEDLPRGIRASEQDLELALESAV